MEESIYSKASAAMLSHVNIEGTFEIAGSKLSVISPEMDGGKLGVLGDAIGSAHPRKFKVWFMKDRIEIEALDPSLQTLEDFLAKLVEKLNTE